MSKKVTLTEGVVKKGGLNTNSSTPRPQRPGAITPQNPSTTTIPAPSVPKK